jgi:hypothetical protein
MRGLAGKIVSGRTICGLNRSTERKALNALISYFFFYLFTVALCCNITPRHMSALNNLHSSVGIETRLWDRLPRGLGSISGRVERLSSP